jgi:TolB-like protein
LNKLSQFWQELKRRKVVRVITVYAAAAFVILELLSIIIEPLRLPEWTLQFAIVFLCIGFVIAVILSWIYDVHPEGGIVKTETAHKVKAEDVPQSSNSWKIASYISFVVIVGLIVLNIVPRTGKKEILEKSIVILPFFEKSIAVLPFTSLSNDPEKQYLADGVMEDILLNLAKIEELRVMSSTSVQQYRNTDKTATEICQELDVSYVLEGRFQKYGDQAKLIVQLIQTGIEGHAWANDYNREWKDIFTVQSEVAQLIAQELRAVITPKEKQLIHKIPTTSVTAHDLYLRGRKEHSKFMRYTPKWDVLKRAQSLYNEALVYDSTYAHVYSGLALVYFEKYEGESMFGASEFDSVLMYANLALSFDDQLEEAYYIRGRYFARKDESVKALKDLDKALQINPNYSGAYVARGQIYTGNLSDYVEGIKNYHKAISLDHGNSLILNLRTLGILYGQMGFVEKADHYHMEVLKIDNDSSSYLEYLSTVKYDESDFKTRLELAEDRYENDSTYLTGLDDLIEINSILGNNIDAYNYALKKIESSRFQGASLRVAFAFWQVGKKDEAKYYFDKQISISLKAIRLNSMYAVRKWAHYDLAAVYAFLGDKGEAYKYLAEVDKTDCYYGWWRDLFKYDPMFNSIRDEPEFQQIARNVEAKYQAEHERVRKWLEENDML